MLKYKETIDREYEICKLITELNDKIQSLVFENFSLEVYEYKIDSILEAQKMLCKIRSLFITSTMLRRQDMFKSDNTI